MSDLPSSVRTSDSMSDNPRGPVGLNPMPIDQTSDDLKERCREKDEAKKAACGQHPNAELRVTPAPPSLDEHAPTVTPGDSNAILMPSIDALIDLLKDERRETYAGTGSTLDHWFHDTKLFDPKDYAAEARRQLSTVKDMDKADVRLREALTVTWSKLLGRVAVYERSHGGWNDAIRRVLVKAIRRQIVCVKTAIHFGIWAETPGEELREPRYINLVEDFHREWSNPDGSLMFDPKASAFSTHLLHELSSMLSPLEMSNTHPGSPSGLDISARANVDPQPIVSSPDGQGNLRLDLLIGQDYAEAPVRLRERPLHSTSEVTVIEPSQSDVNTYPGTKDRSSQDSISSNSVNQQDNDVKPDCEDRYYEDDVSTDSESDSESDSEFSERSFTKLSEVLIKGEVLQGYNAKRGGLKEGSAAKDRVVQPSQQYTPEAFFVELWERRLGGSIANERKAPMIMMDMLIQPIDSDDCLHHMQSLVGAIERPYDPARYDEAGP
ncbi:hypothetical protein IAU60_004298 [Kwoniella sp. DSM 27419]